MAQRMRVTYVIMAGGRGERLWPLVCSTRPKVCLSPDGRRTFLEATVERLSGVWPKADWLVVTTREQGDAVRAGLPARLQRRVLVEPEIKNTAACITLAALSHRDPSRVLVVVPADHWIDNTLAFRDALRAAIRAAVRYDAIATIGIRPTHPHPGLGYVCAGAVLSRGRGPKVFHLARFIEKPSRREAARMLLRGRTWWNSGIFVGTTDKFLECLTEWLPDHTRELAPLAGPWNGGVSRRRLAAAYRKLRAISFDHGVMNHVREGVIVEGRFRWADLGSWDAWAQRSPAAPYVVGIESHNVRVVSQEPHLVATIGMRNVLVVRTPTATLICPSDKAQAVREVVKRLSRRPAWKAFQ